LKNQARKPSYSGLLSGTIGLYPGPEPRRIKLIDVAPEARLTDDDWEQALAHAERSLAVLFRQFQAVTANPLAPAEAYTLFAPARIFVTGLDISVLDGEGQAMALADGWRVVGRLTMQPLSAVFGRSVLVAGGLQLQPLGLITRPPNARFFRLGALP